METKTVNYHFINLNGTAYKIGRQEAARIKQIPALRAWLTGNSVDWKQSYGADAWKTINRYCPYIAEELQGWADELEVRPESLVFCYHSYMVPHCSHFVVAPQMSSNGHLIHCRSYEFDIETHDFRLCYTHAEGKHAHLGNSVLFSGRLDGMNDAGLTVTMSAGGIPRNVLNPKAPPIQEGLQFWAIVRSLLDECRSVDEAIAWLQQVPFGGNPILLLSDTSGNATRVEVFGKKISLTTMAESETIGLLLATNHFRSAEMQGLESYIMPNALVREKNIEGLLCAGKQKVGIPEMKGLLGQSYPEGLACEYYTEGFGTLYSMIVDATTGEFNICLGHPAHNPWQKLTLELAAAKQTFSTPVELPQAVSPAGFWN